MECGDSNCIVGSLLLLLFALVLLFSGSLALLCCLRLLAACCRLLLQCLGLRLLSLRFVDRLNQDALVLVSVTLGLVVAKMVQMLVDFLTFAILAKEPSENTLPT